MKPPVVCILAIDPGLTGALALYFPDAPERVSVYDMPVVDGEVNPAALAARIRQYAPTHAVIEQVGPMPRDGSKQAFRFGMAYGAARTAVAILEVPLTLVTPAAWKRAYRLAGGPDGKEQSRALALRLFPASADAFALVKHHGRAEAALLARWLADRLVGERRAA